MEQPGFSNGVAVQNRCPVPQLLLNLAQGIGLQLGTVILGTMVGDDADIHIRDPYFSKDLRAFSKDPLFLRSRRRRMSLSHTAHRKKIWRRLEYQASMR